MEKDGKNYRPNVAAIILSSTYPFDCNVFLGQRLDMSGVWQFPQGGIDSGETPKMALFRELKEEIGTDDVEIITEYPKWLSYDFPSNVITRMKPYDGQIQKYFLVRLRRGANINLCTKHPEFDAYKFVSVEEVMSSVRHFKREVYGAVLKYFRKEGYI